MPREQFLPSDHNLWSCLPIHESRSVHLLLEVSSDALRCHLIEHIPLWGYHVLDTIQVPEWGEFLRNICHNFHYPDAPRLLLRGGILIEGPLCKTAEEDLLPELGRLLKTHVPEPVDSLFPAGEQVLPLFYSAAQTVTGAAQLLENLLGRPFPDRSNLDEEFRQQVPVFPYTIGLAYARLAHNQLSVGRIPLIRQGGRPSAAGNISGQEKFYMAPDHTTTQVLILQSSKERPEEALITAAELRVDRQPFEVRCEYQYPSSSPRLRVSNASILRILPIETTAVPSRLPAIVEKPQEIELIFLLDGTMGLPDFELARTTILQLSEALNRDGAPNEFAAFVYGEYPREGRDGRTWEPSYELREISFCALPQFAKELRSIAPLESFSNDYCDAMELGLQRVGRIEHGDRIRHILLFGNSPPHPKGKPREGDTVSERAAWGLLDVSAEEFSNRDWLAELNQLLSQENTYLSSVWIQPTPSASMPNKNQQEFAAYVWKMFGRDQWFPRLDGTTQVSLLRFIRGTRIPVKALADRLLLPLIEPLVGIREP